MNEHLFVASLVICRHICRDGACPVYQWIKTGRAPSLQIFHTVSLKLTILPHTDCIAFRQAHCIAFRQAHCIAFRQAHCIAFRQAHSIAWRHVG